MIDVLLVIDSLVQRGGTETQLFELISKVDGSRFRLHVCCLEENTPPLEVPRPHTAQVVPLTKLNSVAAIRQILRLRAYIRRERIGVVQTYMFKASVIGVFAAWGASCRAIVTSRRNLEFARGHELMTGLLNRLSNRILANSETAKSAAVAAEGLSPAKVDVLYNGVDLDRFSRTDAAKSRALSQKLGIPAGAPVVAIIANLRPVKDIPLFLEAARQVAVRVPEARFLIIGDGPLKAQLEAQAAALRIAERVRFAGSAQDVAEYLGFVSVGCLTSVAEGFSNAILEFMAAGIPVVATAVGGNSEAIVHDVTGCLAMQRDPSEIAGLIVGLLMDESRRSTMGQQAQIRCRERFDIRETVRNHEEYWTRLARAAPAIPSKSAAVAR